MKRILVTTALAALFLVPATASADEYRPWIGLWKSGSNTTVSISRLAPGHRRGHELQISGRGKYSVYKGTCDASPTRAYCVARGTRLKDNKVYKGYYEVRRNGRTFTWTWRVKYVGSNEKYSGKSTFRKLQD